MESDPEKKVLVREKWKRQNRRANRSGMELQRVKHQGWRAAVSTEE